MAKRTVFVNRYSTPLTIKIFFCYSDDVKQDVDCLRQELQRRVEVMRRIIELKMQDWRDMGRLDTRPLQQRCQDVYNSAILSSNYVVFLFDKHFGEKTMEEWKLCANRKKPKCLLGIKKDSGNSAHVHDVRNKLGTADTLIDIPYSTITELGDAIMQEFMKDADRRQVAIYRYILSQRDTMSVSQINKLTRHRNEIREVVKEFSKTQDATFVNSSSTIKKQWGNKRSLFSISLINRRGKAMGKREVYRICRNNKNGKGTSF